VEFFISSQFVGELVIGLGSNANIGMATLPYYTANITKAFEDIARSMANRIRITQPSMALGLGLTDVPVGFIFVQWGYLALPLATAVCSELLLIVMIIHTRRAQGVPLWKSSALALLYRHISSPDGTIMSNFQNPKVLEEVAELTKVKLA
jgi:hypothetical protein